MINRTQEQWRALFSEQQASGLKATEFCNNHNICPNYFSKRRKELVNPETKLSSFVSVSSTTVSKTSTLTLHHDKTTLTIPLTVSPDWIANLIRNRKINPTLSKTNPLFYGDNIINQENHHDQTNPSSMAGIIYRTSSQRIKSHRILQQP